MSNTLYHNLTLASMVEGTGPYGLLKDAAIAVQGGLIEWVGPAADIAEDFAQWPRISLDGLVVTPALIDCHTHLVFGGNRAPEFEQRLEGISYEEIARSGGGIMSTVAATRATPAEILLEQALERVDALIAEGIGTIEIKSGYGLDRETELKMLRVARQVASQRPVRVQTTFLGAHAAPREYRERPDEYLDEVCLPTLEVANDEGLVDAVDGFCEGIAFSLSQIERVFDKAAQLSLPVKLHAEQLSNLGGAILAARFGAMSADHLEYLDRAGVVAMAEAGTVGVMLPGAFYTLQETQRPPIEMFREFGIPLAVATDCNPGSSPMSSLLLAMNMACTLFRMTPEESLAGVTRNAALALGLKDRGVVAAGKIADLAVWNIEHPAELAYRMGCCRLHQRIVGAKE